MESSVIYKKINDLDKECKPLILKWLCKLFECNNYPHSFKDQWLIWRISNGELNVIFDERQQEQLKLLSLINPKFLGCVQSNTLKIVNKNTFYVQIQKVINIEYPDIIETKLINKFSHKDNYGDIFHYYQWEVMLGDKTSILYENQSEKCDITKGNYFYNTIIQQREFIKFLRSFN